MDLAFENINGRGFDLAHDGQDLILDDGLITALIHSVFRDARAPVGVIEQDGDRRGHWFSMIDVDAPDGSLLWLLNREKITPNMPHQVAEKLEQACAWMIPETTGPTAPVVAVEARCHKAPGRGRIDGQLNLFLSHTPTPRRFVIAFDADNNIYKLEEV